jgi:1,6-anhydro-N-acetylmuramate kinase
MIVIGLMSGTSADGVSCAVVEIRVLPTLDWRLLHYQTYSYPPALRDEISRVPRVRRRQ